MKQSFLFTAFAFKQSLVYNVFLPILSDNLFIIVGTNIGSTNRKLTKFPACPNIVNILEEFVRKYAVQKLSQLEKQLLKSPYSSQFAKLNSEKEAEKYEEAVNQINVRKEVAECMKIIIDFQVGTFCCTVQQEGKGTVCQVLCNITVLVKYQ